MVNGYVYKPLTYYPLVFFSTTLFWSMAAWLTSKGEPGAPVIALLLAGLAAPFVISILMIVVSGERRLAKDFLARVVDFRLIDLKTLGAASLLMPSVVVASVLLSLPLGGSLDQLRLADGFSFSAGALPVLLVLLLAALFEELGWRGYAFDSLQSRYKFLGASLLFGFLWSAWHLPLLWVKDSYQFNILQESAWYAVNFFVSIVPMGIILSWVCLRSGRSVGAAIIFHFIINISQEMFELSQLTKSVETAVLIFVTVALVIWDRETFLPRNIPERIS